MLNKMRVNVITKSQVRKSTSKNETICVIDEDVKIDYEELQQKCGKELSPVDIDLFLVLGVVAFADRKFNRKAKREFVLQIPVYCSEQWVKSQDSLEDYLDSLTGDYWKLVFIQREDDVKQSFQNTFLKDIEGQTVVIPYSGGMGSYAALNLIQHDNSVKPFLVAIEFKKTLKTKKLVFDTSHSLDKSDNRACVYICFSKPSYPNSLVQSRTFVFFSIAAIAAKLLGSKRVLIPESGQGALGAALMTLGNEHDFEPTVPTLTSKLKKFLSTLWSNNAVNFEHPYLWNTKAEMLHKFEKANRVDDLLKTCSCARNIGRNKGLKNAPKHCGVCSNCLLRRLALVGAGLENYHSKEKYVWESLDAEELKFATNFNIKTTKNDYDIASRAVLNHQQLASITIYSENFKDLAFRLSISLRKPENFVTDQLENLLDRHQQEWYTFLSSFSPHSWIRKIAKDS